MGAASYFLEYLIILIHHPNNPMWTAGPSRCLNTDSVQSVWTLWAFEVLDVIPGGLVRWQEFWILTLPPFSCLTLDKSLYLSGFFFPPHFQSVDSKSTGDMSCSFDPWVGETPWRRKWQPTPVFLPGKSHGQRSLVGYSPWGLQRVGHKWSDLAHTDDNNSALHLTFGRLGEIMYVKDRERLAYRTYLIKSPKNHMLGRAPGP